MVDVDQSAIVLGQVISRLRRGCRLSQEALAGRAGLHRTYISQLERGIKSPTLSVLLKLATALGVRPSRILLLVELSGNHPVKYRTRKEFVIDVGFMVTSANIVRSVELTNDVLTDLPALLYRSLDFKTVSSLVGSILRDALATETDSIVNPVEKGHPELVPMMAGNATTTQLLHYPQGLEVKCTVGNVEPGANLRAGQRRIERLISITWHAHHRQVRSLVGLVWDFARTHGSFSYPAITGVFYTAGREEKDRGTISGTIRRNTKVSGMRTSRKAKMRSGWIMLLDEPSYLTAFQRTLGDWS
jgi:transcriptional regulator with XRE-family HTH domain